MKRILNILIVDDHPIIVNAYKNAFNLNESEFKINTFCASDINTTIEKINSPNLKVNFDLVLLDISLPPCYENKIYSGEDLGLYLKKKQPNIKIIVITSHNDNLRLSNILSNLNPDGLLIKSDITCNDLILAIKTVMVGYPYYSKSISGLLRKKVINDFKLDRLDIEILKEMTNGTKIKEMTQIIPLTKSGIEKRKRLLREKLGTADNTDRELILLARKKGFI